jgi:hypothetical protein
MSIVAADGAEGSPGIEILALVRPYVSSAASGIPIGAAISPTGNIVPCCAKSISV